MTEADLRGYFKLVRFDEIGISEEGMTAEEFDAEAQSIAYEFGLTCEQAIAYVMERVVDEQSRAFLWEKHSQRAAE